MQKYGLILCSTFIFTDLIGKGVDMFSFLKNLFGPKPKKKISRTALQIMTKKELETLGRKYGMELDRRFHKSDLVDQLYAYLRKINK